MGAFQARHQGLHLKNAGDILVIAAIHRVTRERMVAHGVQVFGRIGGRVQPGNAVARGHQAVGGTVAQAHDAIHHVALVGVDDARLVALGHQHADLFFRDRCRLGLAQADDAQHQLGGARQQPHAGGGNARQPAHRHRDKAGDVFRTGQGEAFWHQFAEDQRQVGDQRDGQHLADEARIRLRFADQREGGRQRREGRLQLLGNRAANGVATVDTGQDADQGDADLHRGQEILWFFREFQRPRGALAGAGHLLEAAFARCHDRHFGHGKEAVEQDQREYDKKFKHGSLPGLVAGRAGVCDGHRRSGAESSAAAGDKGRRP
ncbi:hypothetical protein D3C71_1262080 [compost metagenome]